MDYYYNLYLEQVETNEHLENIENKLETIIENNNSSYNSVHTDLGVSNVLFLLFSLIILLVVFEVV